MPMNNTASLRRTERALGGQEALSARLAAQIATVLATVLFTVAFVSFNPFPVVESALEPTSSSGGDVLNQLGYGSLGALALLGLLILVDRRVLYALISPWWLLLLLFVMFAVLNAPSPPDAMRAALFAAISLMVMAASVSLPRDADSFSAMIACSALFILGLCYFGVLAMPSVSIHTAFGPEPEHAGLWRGSFSHKNSAAPVMGCLSFAGIYLWRRGWRFSGAAIALLAVVFLANTGSKTTFGTVPVAACLVLLPAMFGARALVPAFFIIALVAMALATLGIVFIGPLHELQQEMAPGLNYTGRTAVWEFLGEMLADRPWTGYGFESFWGTGTVLLADQPFDRDWDFRGVGHGHNGYLDIAIAMGLPALFVALVAFVLAPLRDFQRVPPLRENVFLADFFLMIAAFILLNAFLESFFFRRAEPAWLLLIFALFGLRLVARLPVPARLRLKDPLRRTVGEGVHGRADG